MVYNRRYNAGGLAYIKNPNRNCLYSSDEAEVLRQNIEAVCQYTTETLASYSQRFREACNKTFLQ